MKELEKNVTQKVYVCENCGSENTNANRIFKCDMCGKEVCISCANQYSFDYEALVDGNMINKYLHYCLCEECDSKSFDKRHKIFGSYYKKQKELKEQYIKKVEDLAKKTIEKVKSLTGGKQ